MKAMQNKYKSFLLLLINFLSISTVYADAGSQQAAAGGGMASSMLMMGAIFVFMYLMIIRPQSKKAKEHRELLSKITKGDEVITQSGIVGKIARETGNFFVLTISDGVEIIIQKPSIAQVLPHGTIKSI